MTKAELNAALSAISALDKDLTLATRTMKAASPAERPEWKHLIDGLLDRRLELMRRHTAANLKATAASSSAH